MKRPKKTGTTLIPVYTPEQVKHLPVPAGCVLADLAPVGERGSIIWKRVTGGALVDYEAMARRDAQMDKRHES